jgi:general secretion pathway protein D
MGFKSFFIYASILMISICSSSSWAGSKVSINFRNTDINAVIETVAKLTGKNFLVSPKVKGRVTIISSTDLDAKDLYEVFLSILTMYGFATIENKGLIKIVPIKAARESASDVQKVNAYTRVTRVIKLQYIEANQLISTLRPLVSPYAQIAALRNANSILVHDTHVNVRRIAKLVSQIDTIEPKEFTIMSLEYADAQTISKMVKTLYSSNKRSAALAIEVDLRTNKLIIAANKKVIESIKALIKKLDKPIKDQGNIEIVYLKYAKAKTIAPLIEKVLTSSAFAAIDQRSNANKKSSKKNKSMVKAYEEMNSLLISSSPASLQAIKNIVRKLDIPRAQVQIEAIIAEVGEENEIDFGLDTGYYDVDSNAALGSSVIDKSGILKDGLQSLITNIISPTSSPSLGAGLTLPLGNVATTDTGAATSGWVSLLRALETNSNSNILSTPSIITLDNEQATIVVGQTRYIEIGSTIVDGVTTYNTEAQDLGIKLIVKPQLNNGDAILLEIEYEDSSIAAGDQQNTANRSIKTKVLTKNGQLIVLGGLMKETQVESETKVPWLGDIPILGWFFKSVYTTTVKKNLLVFIRPTILASDTIASSISYGKYNALRREQLIVSDNNAFNSDLAPILEDLGLSEIDIAGEIAALQKAGHATTGKNTTPEAQTLPKKQEWQELHELHNQRINELKQDVQSEMQKAQ